MNPKFRLALVDHDHDEHSPSFQLEFECQIDCCEFFSRPSSPLSTSITGGLKPSISSPGLKAPPSSPLGQSVFITYEEGLFSNKIQMKINSSRFTFAVVVGVKAAHHGGFG